jgi:hypothetical protein
MLFIFKHKPIHLDCFTHNTMAYNYGEIAPAINYVPKWWKSLPVGNKEFKTMKGCAGFIDLYQKGFVVPLWSDLALTVHKDNLDWEFADRNTCITPHANIQAGQLFDDANCIHIKIQSPWQFKCKEDIYWHFSQPIWNDLAGKNYCVPSGVIEFKYQYSVNINVLVRKNIGTFTIPHNHPMAHIIPLSERPLKIHNHLIGFEEFNNIGGTSEVVFNNRYYKLKKIAQEKESKCPFGFGK